jgi:hypothetical protein
MLYAPLIRSDLPALIDGLSDRGSALQVRFHRRSASPGQASYKKSPHLMDRLAG